MTTTIVLGELDFPVKGVDQRMVAVPVYGSVSPANLYLRVTLVVKANLGELGHSQDWQDVYAVIPITMFEPNDYLLEVAPSFLLGGIERQESGFASLDSDNWKLALDQTPGPPPTKLPPQVGIDAWWRDTQDPRVLMLTYRLRNVGQCQIPDVCLAVDVLVYRPELAHRDEPRTFHGHIPKQATVTLTR